MEKTLKRIVWIASYPKSGNTWIRLFIAALRHRAAGQAEPYNPNAVSKQPDFYQDNARGLYEPLFRNGWSNAHKQDMAAARPVVHRWIAKNAKTAAPIVKTHNAFISVNGVPTITPDVTRCAIYLVRHPYDVAISVKDHFGARDYDHAIEQLIFRNYVQPRDDRFIDAPVGSWPQNVLSWTERPARNVHVIRYEDLIGRPETTFKRVAAVLGVTDMSLITQAMSDVDISRLKATEDSDGFVEKSSRAGKFFARGRAGAGSEELTAVQKAKIKAATAQAAALHGYKFD